MLYKQDDELMHCSPVAVITGLLCQLVKVNKIHGQEYNLQQPEFASSVICKEMQQPEFASLVIYKEMWLWSMQSFFD